MPIFWKQSKGVGISEDVAVVNVVSQQPLSKGVGNGGLPYS